MENTSQNSPIQLTPSALKRVREFNGKKEGTLFKISVDAGGCSGFQYDFGFDTPQASDVVFSLEDIRLIISQEAIPYINGSTIDFVDDFKGTGFTVANPNAKATCGCGVSFTV